MENRRMYTTVGVVFSSLNLFGSISMRKRATRKIYCDDWP